MFDLTCLLAPLSCCNVCNYAFADSMKKKDLGRSRMINRRISKTELGLLLLKLRWKKREKRENVGKEDESWSKVVCFSSFGFW